MLAEDPRDVVRLATAPNPAQAHIWELALKIISCPVKGLRPIRALVAGFLTSFSFSRPGIVTMPAPFLPRWSLIRFDKASNTEPTCFRFKPVAVDSSW